VTANPPVEPLPCPFCGSKSLIELQPDAFLPAEVRCADCDESDFSPVVQRGDTIAGAIAAWNRRTPAPSREPLPTIKRLRELLAQSAALPWTADNREPWDRVVWSSQPQADDPTETELVFNVGQPMVRVGDPCGDADEAHCNLIAEGISALPMLLDLAEIACRAPLAPETPDE
jgi:hypothetical protein